MDTAHCVFREKYKYRKQFRRDIALRNRKSLHLPVVLNPNASKYRAGELNGKVSEIICKTPGLHILGVNRGEHNMVSIVVIDGTDGHIVEQKSLNVMDGFDYRKALVKGKSNARTTAATGTPSVTSRTSRKDIFPRSSAK